MVDGITAKQFHESEGVEDWRVVGEGACTFFLTGSFAAGARFVQAIGGLAGLDEHHPRRQAPTGGLKIVSTFRQGGRGLAWRC